MMSEAMQAAINKQINREIYSAYIYASMATYFEHRSLKGFANWMRMQSEEELDHARKFTTYMQDRGARVVFTSVDAPRTDWGAPLEVFTDAYNHECHITACINELSSQAIAEKDHATHALLEWFVTEQVEEESNADQIVQQLKLADGAPGALFLLDRELGARKPEPEGQ